jgi:hypothetical protein
MQAVTSRDGRISLGDLLSFAQHFITLLDRNPMSKNEPQLKTLLMWQT